MTEFISTKVWQHFVPLLAEVVSRPCEEHPTVRVWKDTSLIHVINRVGKRIRTDLRTSFPPGNKVEEQMVRMKWLHCLPLTENVKGRKIYLMDQEATKEEVIDPLEVLQAVLPSGVISYFGAVGFYELTTQMPAFFHIGRLVSGMPLEATVPVEGSGRNPLGMRLFDFDGIRCYETKRFCGLTPGVQMREIGPRTCYRVTTLEQTLLDTILQPVRCGGEAVVFEAWGHAKKQADFDRMAEYLQTIGRTSLIRRVGAMLEMFDTTVGDSSALGRLLCAAKSRIGSHDEMVALLPGLNYGQISGGWRVFVP